MYSNADRTLTYSNLVSPDLRRKTRQIPGDFVMSPSECIKLYDALETTLGKKAVARVEPKKVRRPMYSQLFYLIYICYLISVI